MPGIMVGMFIVETITDAVLGLLVVAPVAATGAMDHVAVNMLRQVPAVPFDSGRCLIFCSSSTWWFSSL